MTYTPKTSAQQVSNGWADFNNQPSKQEIFKRQLKADGIVDPKLVVADVALEEIPNGSVVRAMFGTRKESFKLTDGQWEDAGFRKVHTSAWIIANILSDARATEWALEIPVSEWHNFQK